MKQKNSIGLLVRAAERLWTFSSGDIDLAYEIEAVWAMAFSLIRENDTLGLKVNRVIRLPIIYRPIVGDTISFAKRCNIEIEKLGCSGYIRIEGRFYQIAFFLEFLRQYYGRIWNILELGIDTTPPLKENLNIFTIKILSEYREIILLSEKCVDGLHEMKINTGNFDGFPNDWVISLTINFAQRILNEIDPPKHAFTVRDVRDLGDKIFTTQKLPRTFRIARH